MSNSITPLIAVTLAASESSRAASAATGLDAALQALESYKDGSSRAALLPIDQAVITSLRDQGLRQQLETRLTALLTKPISVVAREYICRQLGRMGSAGSVPALAELLAEKELADTARSALESIPGAEATDALRQKLSELSGLQKVGVIQSLGARRDESSVPALERLLQGSDTQIATAAAAALGRIGSAEAARALASQTNLADAAFALEVADARLACAEALSSQGKRSEALAIYKSLVGASQPAQVQLAAKRGLLVSMQQRSAP
jgi:HEAT repeat protein